MMPSAKREDIDHRLTDLTSQFARYVAAFDNEPPFKPEQLQSHLHTLEVRSRFPRAYNAASDETFARSLKKTLHSWRLDTRIAEIVSQGEFHNQLFQIRSMLEPLENCRINSSDLGVSSTACRLWEIIERLDIVRIRKTKEPVRNKVVSGTKVLHHLLPNLVFPIDRKYTETFFDWSSFDNHPEECFKFAFQSISEVAREVSLAVYLGSGWRTSLAKILDNAIVGYCQVHKLKLKQTKQREREKYLIELGRRTKAEGFGSG